MVRSRLAVFLFSFLVITSVAHGEVGRVDGTLGSGFANLNGLSPSPDFRINPGTFFTLQAEKPMGATSFYLVGSINYIHSTGSLNYNYYSPTEITYTQNNVNYAMDKVEANLGVTFKFFDYGNIRPYVGGGGEGGFMQLTYDNSLRTPAVLAAGNDFATIDNAIDLGLYGEGGVEVQLTGNIGVRLAFRYIDTYSHPVPTLNNQSVHMDDTVYYAGIMVAF